MNERIKELWLKSGGRYSESNQLGSYYYTSDPEKFAELIVKECADIATNRYERLMNGGKAIKEHFGVEE